MIADKAAVVVNPIFDHYQGYAGIYVWVGAIFYSFQLYADFLSCTTISKGVAKLYGISIIDNFNHPYFATSIKDFWRRWHMSLSSWLRDYIYIPLGGNRKGRLFKWINLTITFLVSGLWHGSTWKFIAWGFLHAMYQIFGEIKDIIVSKYNIDRYKMSNRKIATYIHRTITFILVMMGWIIFRADTLKISIEMIKSMIINVNPWVLFNDSLFDIGLSWKEWIVLMVSLTILAYVSSIQEKGAIVCNWISKQNILVRWLIYLIAIWAIWIFGTYGYGYDAKDFIYGGF